MNMFQSARVWAIWHQPPPSQSMFKPYLISWWPSCSQGHFKSQFTSHWSDSCGLCCDFGSATLIPLTRPQIHGWPLSGVWSISTLCISDTVLTGVLSSWVSSTWYHIKLKLLAFLYKSPHFTHFTFCGVFHLLPLAGSYGHWLTSSHYSPFSRNPDSYLGFLYPDALSWASSFRASALWAF